MQSYAYLHVYTQSVWYNISMYTWTHADFVLLWGNLQGAQNTAPTSNLGFTQAELSRFQNV